ncbi:MAG: chromosomal replication initiator protein DnaA [Bryobacteraceae bacterium]|nr:chromosomal replication initiator protein DnaA [Bryobacteraceae bacterium]
MDFWEEVKRGLAGQISEEGLLNWVSKTRLSRVAGQTLWVAVPNEATKKWMEAEYSRQVSATVAKLRLPVAEVRYEVAAAESSSAVLTASEPVSFNGSHLNPKLTFRTFVIGSSNQFAHSAAARVAANPGKGINPLFLYGGSGVGKTHLMNAIAEEASARYPSMRVVYAPAERFLNQLVQSIKSDRMALFQRHYRTADLLLIDDVQNLAGKEKTQEEFLYTFNELFENGKQIVVSSDVHPKHIHGLPERLRSRFESGLHADLLPPDLETKMAILSAKAAIDGIDLPEDVRIHIATKAKASVRELEAALVKLATYSSVTEERISISMAHNILKHLSQTTDKRISIDSIVRLVAERFQLQPAQLKMKSNERKIAYPRQIAMYIAKELTHASLPEIGRAFGNKHHTTVLHSVQKIEALRLKDPDLNKLLHNLSDTLTA